MGVNLRAGTPVRGLGPAIRPLAVASLAANIGIVVTGGAVRLTGSGLGCPTWPRCTPESFTPHGALGVHGAIEFGNRMLTFVLVAVALATWVAALNYVPRRRDLVVLATVLALGVPAQAVIGGLAVLTDLNPWVVSLHFMLSMGLIAVSVALVRRTRRSWSPIASGGSALPARLRGLAVAVFCVTFVVLYVGTVVTGSGPHAGDADAPRNGLDPRLLSHLHAALVYLLITLSVTALVWLRRMGGPGEARRAAWMVLMVELAQGSLGFAQYFSNLPELLVGLHLLGAALLTAAVTWLLLAAGTRADCRQQSARRETPRSAGGQRVISGSTATARNSRAR
ncbi:MAG TPA: COX15/CtaA family protein [Nocardioidaceae bacterium]|jgi:cytochrome c oxidase assembly protein subunit 15|nr:COX15/CtaA family protein [Actinomycetota bacterium]HEV8056683.1 COX15/CtaA family protein [Nocardioidaceae bacterium]